MEFDELEEEICEETPDLKETVELEEEDIPEFMAALLKPPEMRTWREAELVDIYRHPKYQAQLAFATDPDTKEVLRDEEGELIRCSRNTHGAQVPDGFYEDDLGIHIREVKDYTDPKLLMGDMAYQTYKRRQGFGKDIDLVFAISPKFTIEEAEEIQAYASSFLNVEVEYQLK